MAIELPIFPIPESDYKDACLMQVAFGPLMKGSQAKILNMEYNGVHLGEYEDICDWCVWIKNWDGARTYLYKLTEKDTGKDHKHLWVGDFVSCSVFEASHWMEAMG